MSDVAVIFGVDSRLPVLTKKGAKVRVTITRPMRLLRLSFCESIAACINTLVLDTSDHVLELQMPPDLRKDAGPLNVVGLNIERGIVFDKGNDVTFWITTNANRRICFTCIGAPLELSPTNEPKGG